MLNLTTAIVTAFAGSTLSSAIGGRLRKGQAEEGIEYPYAVFFVVTDVPSHTFTEDYENVLIQFSLFSTASGTTEVENMYTYLKVLYDEKSFAITGSTLVWMRRSNAMFSVEDHTTASGVQRVWHWAVEFEILTSLD